MKIYKKASITVTLLSIVFYCSIANVKIVRAENFTYTTEGTIKYVTKAYIDIIEHYDDGETTFPRGEDYAWFDFEFTQNVTITVKMTNGVKTYSVNDTSCTKNGVRNNKGVTGNGDGYFDGWCYALTNNTAYTNNHSGSYTSNNSVASVDVKSNSSLDSFVDSIYDDEVNWWVTDWREYKYSLQSATLTFNVDTIAPTISGLDSSYEWTNHDVTISANLFDNANNMQSGIKSVILYDSNNNILSKKIENEKYAYTPYWYNGQDYGRVFNALYYADRYSDMAYNYGTNADALFGHFINYGIYEDRVASPYFDINIYKSNNQDIVNNSYWGSTNLTMLYHFIYYGFLDGCRVANDINYLKYTFTIEGVNNYYIIATDMAGNSSRKDFTVNTVKNVNYTVNHYLMNLDGTTYFLKDVQSLSGTISSSITPEVKNYTGFTSPAPTSVIITADGKAKVNYYYTRDKYIIRFIANGGNGTMPDLVNYNQTINLPTHNFIKNNTAGKSKFIGWNTNSKSKDALYQENAQVGNLSLSDNDVITLYAIWDDCPIITAKDRYYTLHDAKNGIITQEDLLTTVTVTDDRDTVFTQSLKVVDYNPLEFKQFASDGTSLIKYQVTDSNGNISTTTSTVYIVDTTPVVIQTNSYVRFISEKFYKNSYEEGGLEENSLWKTDPAYVAVLESAMENRRSLTYEKGSINLLGIDYKYTKPGSISQDHIYETWTFTPEDITRVKEYINTHGFGKFKEDSALVNFRTELMSCKK